MSRIAFLLLMALFAIVKCQSTTNTTTTPTNSTTTEPTTNTTTAAPTTASPTTTSIPTPTPPIPKADKWSGNVTKDKNTCIKVQFAVEIRIKYNNTNGTEVTTGFNIPIDATVDEHKSSCNSSRDQIEIIVISFVDQEYTSANLTLRFNSTKDNAFVEEIELSYILTEQLFPSFNKSEYNKTVKVSKTGLTLFSVATDHSYVCSEQKPVLLSNEGSSLGTEVDFIDAKVEAYIDKSKNGKFDSEINCKSTEISDVVPIAVGAALAGLVLIVLIAYFIGRRRSRRLAYQSV